MKVYILTSVDTSALHEIDAEYVLNTGKPYSSLEGAKKAAQEEVNEDIANYNEVFAEDDEQHKPVQLNWIDRTTYSLTTNDDDYATSFMIREQEVGN